MISCEDKEKSSIDIIPEPSLVKYGNGRFDFNSYEPLKDKPVTVYTYLPDEENKDIPIIFVMHGQNRNAKDYCAAWNSPAREYGFLVVCPEINSEYYPNSAFYQQGGMYNDDNYLDSTFWTFNLIEEIFSHLQAENVTAAKTYGIYGHSAGSQFVHRYALFTDPTNASIIIPSNAGWYTLTSMGENFPYGLKGSPLSNNRLVSKFSLPLVLLLGEEDTNPNDPSLRKTSQAMRQGAHRYARGKFFYNIAKTKATELGADFNWKLQTVPSVGHSNANIAPVAAKLFFDSLGN